MPTPAEYDITRIYSSLQLELVDQEAEQANKQVDLFFDTFDVITAVVGLQEYFDARDGTDAISKEKLEGFYTPAALVDCLLAGGWLGTFHLLPPHQAEFLRKLDNRDVFQRVKWPDKRIPDFLHAVGIRDEGEQVVRLESMNEDQRREFIRKQAVSADRFFKAFQCVRESWWKRLNRWRGGSAKDVPPLLDTTLPEIDYRKLVATQEFSAILKEFERGRHITQTPYGTSPASVNNLADAMALAMLMELTRRFNAGESNRLPRFFDSKERFGKVAQRAGVDAQLQVKVKGHESPVLVGADYLIYKATFRRPPAERGTGRSTRSSPASLREIHQAIGHVVGQDPTERLRALDWVQLSNGRYLGDVIKELLRLSFLQNVWLNDLAEVELAQFASDYQVTVKEMEETTTEGFKAQVQSEIAATRKALSHADEYKRHSTALINLHHRVLGLRSSGRGRRPQFHPIRDLKLVRFVLPPNVQQRVDEMMKSLLSSSIDDHDIMEQPGWNQLVDAYFGTGLENAQLTAAALWAMQDYRSIVDPQHNLSDKYDDHSIRVIYAAACIEMGNESELNRCERLLGSMVESFRRDEVSLATEAAEAWRLGQRAMGIAYLYFHIWQSRGYKAKWREFDDRTTDNRTPQDEERGRSLIASAVEFAQKADDCFRRAERPGLPPDPEMRTERVYAANQLLYYLVEQGDPGQEKAMESAARALANLKDRWRDAWQSTFDDSLARHHHFLASRNRDDPAKWHKLLELAIRYSKAAVEGDSTDSQASDYNAQLVREMTRKTVPG